MAHSKLLLIGAGKMGSALLSAWKKAGWPVAAISVVEADTAQVKALSKKGIKAFTSLEQVKTVPDCIVIAVKPQSMGVLVPLLAKKFGNKPLYLSIAAGKTIAYFERHLGSATAIVRAMPNTPALIAKGISALTANKKVSVKQKKLATSILEPAGGVVWIENESLMDVVTAISGSGPAYVFLFMEILSALGKYYGLGEAVAKKLAIETVYGASELARGSKESLEQLRKNVTSPGGTTEAALTALMSGNELETLLQLAVERAMKRSKELA